jgi:hypothetical protein
MYSIFSHTLLGPCLPVDARRPLFEKGRTRDIQMLSGSDRSQGLVLSARFSAVLNLCVRVLYIMPPFCDTDLLFRSMSNLCQNPGLRA